MLPSDPMILVSFINTKLRDEYESLDDLCQKEDADKAELIAKLATINYKYNEKLNKFV